MRKSTVSCLLIAAFVLLPLTRSQAQSVKILQRARLGNNTEDITFIGNGPLAGNIAVMDGYEVRGLRAKGGSPRKLFDVRRLGIEVAPRGIAYISSGQLFALDDGVQQTKLFFADDRGRPKGTSTIQYLNNFFPDFLEGLGYIPKSATSFPDHILLSAVIFNPQASRIEVPRRDGQVEAEIIPGDPLSSSYITGVSYLAPDRILVTTGNTIWEIDFGGNILAGPVTLYGVGDIEGITQLTSGEIVASDYEAGTIFFYDKNLKRLQRKDLDYKVGVGVSGPQGVAWNTDTYQHLINHSSPRTEIVSIPQTLDSATQLVDLGADGLDFREHLTYLPDEHLIAGTNRPSPDAIVLFDNSGNVVEEIDVSAFGRPAAIAYIPTAKQFAVGFVESPLQLNVLDRSGNLVRTIDLSALGISRVAGLTFFDPADQSGGKFLMIVDDATNLLQAFVMVIDFNGNLRRKLDIRKTFGLLGVSDVSTITNGSQRGAFGMVNGDDSEIVIFRLH